MKERGKGTPPQQTLTPAELTGGQTTEAKHNSNNNNKHSLLKVQGWHAVISRTIRKSPLEIISLYVGTINSCGYFFMCLVLGYVCQDYYSC